jgi:uncharacterized protein
MAISGFSRSEFESVLKQFLSPTTPIRSPEFLRGRHKKLEDIRRALVQPGRHIFVYGDRGVGKTSLAQTAAAEHQASSQHPVYLACDPASGFYRIARDIAAALLALDPTVTRRVSGSKGGIGISGFLSADHQISIERGKVPELQSINETVAAIEHVAKAHSTAPVIIVDEFERIQDPKERTLFADLIKQLGVVSKKVVQPGEGCCAFEG